MPDCAGQVLEEDVHVDTDLFGVAVDAAPGLGFSTHAWVADGGEDGQNLQLADEVTKRATSRSGAERVSRDFALAGADGCDDAARDGVGL